MKTEAETIEEKKGLIEEAGVALTDDELVKVSGGTEGDVPGPDDDGHVQETFRPSPVLPWN